MTLPKIRFRQTGGFAGLVRGSELTPESLDAKTRARLERLLAKSGLAAGGAARASSDSVGTRDPASDLIQYELDIETSAGTEHFVFDDSDLPEKVAPLVEFLQERAGPMPLDGGKK
jgi:hypothetical protein